MGVSQGMGTEAHHPGLFAERPDDLPRPLAPERAAARAAEQRTGSLAGDGGGDQVAERGDEGDEAPARALAHHSGAAAAGVL